MLCEDAQQLAGAPHNRSGGASANAGAGPKERSASMVARLPYIARGCMAQRPSQSSACAALQVSSATSWPNLMLINVSTRKFTRAVRLPEGDLPVIAGDGISKSAASPRLLAVLG